MHIQIIIIDPDLDSAKQLKYALQNDIIRAHYTISVTEGIRHLVQFHYQLVIIDVSSGKNDEFRALRKVRELSAIPILAISTNGESEHIVQALAIADDYRQKPYALYLISK